jgi:hypothetical protein
LIVVVGSPVVGPDTLRPGRRAAGLAVGIALAARAAGATVELVGKVGDDPDGDGLAVELEREGVGHAALLRDPSAATPHAGRGPESQTGLPASRADVDLALRYLTDANVIVAVRQADASVSEGIEEAAGYAGAHLIVVEQGNANGGRGGGSPDASTETVTRLTASAKDEGAFAAVVGGYAAALDRGERPTAAFEGAIDAVGWEPTHG